MFHKIFRYIYFWYFHTSWKIRKNFLNIWYGTIHWHTLVPLPNFSSSTTNTRNAILKKCFSDNLILSICFNLGDKEKKTFTILVSIISFLSMNLPVLLWKMRSIVAPLKPLKAWQFFLKSNLYIKENMIWRFIFRFFPQQPQHHK